jgi:hypothetical protein
MTSNVGQGSGSNCDDMLAAILKQLVAMDECLRSMESKLHNIDTMQAKVSTLEESTGEPGAQQDTLSSAVEHIDLAQTQLTANAERGATAPRNPPMAYLSTPATAGKETMMTRSAMTLCPRHTS